MYVGSFIGSVLLIVFYVNSYGSSLGSERDDRFGISGYITLPTAQTLREEILEKGFKDCLVKIRDLVTDHPAQHCFLSYVNEDPDMLWMGRIESYLREVGVRTTYDMRTLGVGDSIMDFIQKIKQAHHAIVLYSPRYLTNFERGTYIRTEADEILKKWMDVEDFVIPLLLAEHANGSIPSLMNRRSKDAAETVVIEGHVLESFSQQAKGLDTLYISLTKESDHADFEECLECIFRMLKERIYKSIIGADTPSERYFDCIKRSFDNRKARIPERVVYTKLKATRGSFPQSLKTYNAFFDRTNDVGQSYVDTIFEELFMGDIDERQFATLTICALSGMGGVGKTTLATEFVHKYKQFYQFVCWMDGSSKRNFLSSCITLLESFGIRVPEQKEEKEDSYFLMIIGMINEFLPKHKKNWLLIVDNIEESEFITEFAPAGGHVLYTSRNRDWLNRLEIDVFKPDESVAYLSQMTGFDESHRDEAMALAVELDHLPLALAQVAAYISRQRLSSYAEYLVRYQESQRGLKVLLSSKQLQYSLNRREAIVMTTWDTTMQKLRPEAKSILYYIAYMAASSIPKALFSDLEQYDQAINELFTYSMIKLSEEENSISVHNLVQKVSQIKQEREGFDASTHIEYVLSSLYRNWKETEQMYLMGNDLINSKAKYDHNFLLNAHVTSVYEHLQRLQMEKLFSKKRKRVFQNKDRFVNVKIANYGLKTLIEQAVLSLRKEAFYDEFASSSQPTSLIEILKETFSDEEDIILTEADYQEIIVLLPQLISGNFYGENTPIDCARILASVSGDEDRQAFVNMINQLCFDDLYELSFFLKPTFVQIAQSCVDVKPEDRESFVNCTKPLLLVLKQFVDKSNYYGEYESLISAVINEEPQNRQLFVEAIRPFADRIPSEEFITFAHNFVLNLESTIYSSATQDILNLLRNDLNEDDICIILNTVVDEYDSIPYKQDFVKRVYSLFDHLPSEDYTYAIIAALKVEPSKFNMFMTEIAPSYSVINSKGDSRSWILPSLCLLEKKTHASFISCVESLLAEDMVKGGCYNIARFLAEVDEKLWYDFGNITQRIFAYSPEISNDNKEYVINILKQRFDDIKNVGATLIKAAEPLLLLDKTGDYYAPIFESLIKFKGNRVQFVNIMLSLLPADTNGHKFGELIHSFASCNIKQLKELKSVLKPLIELMFKDERISRNTYNFINLIQSLETLSLKEKRYFIQKVILAYKAAYIAEQDLPLSNVWLKNIAYDWLEKNMFSSSHEQKSILSFFKMIKEAMYDVG